MKTRATLRLWDWMSAPQLMALAMLVLALVAVLSVVLVLSPPWIGWQLQAPASGPGLLVTQFDHRADRAMPAPLAGQTVVALHARQGDRIPLAARDLIEDPDVLPDYATINAFWQLQTRLASALANDVVQLEMADGHLLTISTQERPLASLPVYFWWQLAAGWICWLIAAGVWAFRPRQLAAWLLLLSGWGALLFTHGAALYGNRELALDGALFQTLLAITHLGSVLHTAALLGLVWVYPCRLGSKRTLVLVFGIGIVAWLADTLQLTRSPLSSYYLFINAAFVVGLILIWGQWRATRERPVQRAIMQWFIPAIFLASFANIGLLKLPLLFGQAVPVRQGWIFAAHSLMYVGLALGILRYRLFDLDRWWFRFWFWFFGGLAFLAVDAILLLGLNLSHPRALFVALAISGWAYFPLRQWLWGRAIYKSRPPLHDLAPALVSRLVVAQTVPEMNAAWRRALQDQLQPLAIDVAPGMGQTARLPHIRRDGTQLAVPDLQDQMLLLSYPGHGRRLFSQVDLKQVRVLLDMARRIQDAAQAREQGATAERQRIMRDLHDDLGARLLSLVYAADTERAADLARAAMDDLHGIVAAARGQPIALTDAVDSWRSELIRRLDEAAIRNDCQLRLLPDRELQLPARLHLNTERILRELTSNIIRHAQPAQVRGHFAQQPHAIAISLWHDGDSAAPEQWRAGNGLRSIHRRASEIDAVMRWQPSGAGHELRLEIPLPQERQPVS